MQMRAFRGSRTVMSFRLCSRAPWTISSSAAMDCHSSSRTYVRKGARPPQGIASDADTRPAPERRKGAAMKGIIFNLFEEVVVSEHGDDAWEDMLERAGIDGAYTAVGSYPDVEFITLLKAMPAGESDDSPDDLLRWFGAKAIPLLS